MNRVRRIIDISAAVLAAALAGALVAVAAVSFLMSHGVAVAQMRTDRSHAMVRRPMLTSHGVTSVEGRRLDAQVRAIASEGVQRIALDTSRGELTPDYIYVAAGMPVEIRFESSDGCAERIVIEGVEPVASGGGRVLLPPLAPGMYGVSCGGSEPDGLLLVR